MKAISYNPWTGLFSLLPIALSDDKGAMDDYWTVEDNPRSRVCLFAFLIFFFFLLHVERFSVALWFFPKSAKENDIYLQLPADHPLFFTTE